MAIREQLAVPDAPLDNYPTRVRQQQKGVPLFVAVPGVEQGQEGVGGGLCPYTSTPTQVTLVDHGLCDGLPTAPQGPLT
jgi:hypothetical protein